MLFKDCFFTTVEDGLGVIIVAIKKTNGEMKFNPTFRSMVKAGDTLIAIGETVKLKILEDMAITEK